MELSILKKPNLVVALDIGSTYSGYAWQWRKDFQDNRSNVEFNTNWGAGGVQLHKTTTCLLLDKNHEIDSFGHKAETRWFSDYYDQEDSDNWFFFKEFKLALYKPDRFNEQMQVEAFNDCPHPLMDVMSKFIRALKDHFINNLESRGQPMNMGDTLWVVTVPAIWTDQAKNFMRQAAEKSGIDKKHLLLANEPESAALYCLHLPSEQRRGMNNFGGVGDKFLTVDLGGGTLDMSAIEVLPDGNVKEICAGTGQRVGGQNVNNAFVQSCKDVIDGDAWHHLAGSRNAEELLKMETDFESRKVQIGSSDERDERIFIHMPPSMMSMALEGKLSIKPGAKQSKYFRVDKGQLMFRSALIRDLLFQETVEIILEHVKSMLERVELKDLTTIVLVGGFAQSQIVVEKIRALLSENFPRIKAVIPTSPFRAVLTGAVLFGHDPLIFQSRISRATFGVGTYALFDPSKHDENKKFRNEEDGKDYSKDIFSIHVRKDKPVKLTAKQPSQIYNPMYKNLTDINVTIFTSPEQEPKYITEEGCKQIGNITVNLPDTKSGTDRDVKVEMIYGGTELSIIATDETTGQEYPTDIQFESF